MKPDAMRAVIDNYIKAYNAFDVKGMLACLHEDIWFQNVSSGQYQLAVTGKAEFGELAQGAIDLFSARAQTITSVEFSNDKAVASIAYAGTLAADMPGFGAAGQQIALTGESHFEFEDGLILRLIDKN